MQKVSFSWNCLCRPKFFFFQMNVFVVVTFWRQQKQKNISYRISYLDHQDPYNFRDPEDIVDNFLSVVRYKIQVKCVFWYTELAVCYFRKHD